VTEHDFGMPPLSDRRLGAVRGALDRTRAAGMQRLRAQGMKPPVAQPFRERARR
jgi:hypothetical protein